MSSAFPASHRLSVLIGNTPLLAVDLRYRGKKRRVFAKAEHFNLTGSIKDRMALHVLRRAYGRGELAPGGPIVEATSGNTGISFAAIGRALGHPVHVFMPDWMSRERMDLMTSLGARLRLVSREEGGFLGSIRLSEEFAAGLPGAFLPRQFSNADNVEAHAATTGPELLCQLGELGLAPDAFVAGVGTGGTIMGVGRYLRSKRPQVRVHPLEPSNSPTLSAGRKVGRHRIQGISDEFIPPIVELASLDRVVAVDDGDAIQTARKLSAELGLAVGISSGANLLGALLLQEELGEDAVVATVFPDDNKKYLSTDLMREQPAKEHFLSTDLTFTGFEASRRSCETCRAGDGRRTAALR
ncbi:MAG: PLP-dependent cysteine synthase family protein [Elusimicrobia bacterium]|nr:PLP-dependent cysteine synthase family protein [Elusimicrobiota bacterium]